MIKKLTYISFDVEATGLDPYQGAKVFSYSTCSEAGLVSVNRLDCPKMGRKHEDDLRELLLDPSIVKICHNFHFENAILLENGFEIHPDTIWEDTMLLSQLLDNIAAGHGLDEVAVRLCPDVKTIKEWMDIDSQIIKARGIYGTYDKIPKPLMERYQFNDAERTMLIYKALSPHVKKNDLCYKDYLNEIELVKATISFERRGIMLCRAEAEKLLIWLNDELKKVEVESFKVLGQYVNLNSGPQVASIIYENMKLPILSMTPAGNPAVDKDALEELRPYAKKLGENVLNLFDLILMQRSYTKGVAMITSYIAAAGASGIIHPHINTNKAQTGRESGENPNMQNISKEAALKTRFPVPARKCFRARPGYILILLDYSGIEMRLIVDVAGEAEFIELIKNNGDPHDLAAQIFYGDLYTDEAAAIQFILSSDKNFKGDYKKAKKILRTAAKNSQFALAYGARLPKVAETLMLSVEAAAPGYRAYSARFPKVAGFTNRMMAQIKKVGYVTTPFGRKLKVMPDKPYSASNYIIQGTAAGILKRAQVHVDQYLKAWWGDVHLVLPIHDELIIECNRKYLPSVKNLIAGIRDQMIDMPEIKVPLEVETKLTTYIWSDAKEFK
jgi:DNA polymerase-1